MILRVLAGAAIIALLIVGWLTINDAQNTPPPLPVARKVPNPGYSAQDVQLVETGPDGRPMYTLHASEIRQQPASDFVTLENVTLQFRDPAGDLWNGRANEGVVSNGASNVDLTGAVTLSGRLPSDQAPIAISSNTLAVDTRTEVVTTQDPVVFELSGQQLSARGMVAHLKDERVQLESDVHGLYRP
jgi:lipopolysaccharide export system protein LptC